MILVDANLLVYAYSRVEQSAFERLEPGAAKVARSVLKGAWGRQRPLPT